MLLLRMHTCIYILTIRLQLGLLINFAIFVAGIYYMQNKFTVLGPVYMYTINMLQLQWNLSHLCSCEVPLSLLGECSKISCK